MVLFCLITQVNLLFTHGAYSLSISLLFWRAEATIIGDAFIFTGLWGLIVLLSDISESLKLIKNFAGLYFLSTRVWSIPLISFDTLTTQALLM